MDYTKYSKIALIRDLEREKRSNTQLRARIEAQNHEIADLRQRIRTLMR